MSIIFMPVFLVPSDERLDNLVDAHYVARRFGCSTRSVQAGLCGTGGLRRVMSKPLRFRRRDINALLQELHGPKKAEPARRGLIRRKPR
jgi:hypothetical protein